MGRLYERAGLADDALDAYRQCGRLAEAVRASAVLLRRLRRYEEAAEAWRVLLGLRDCTPGYVREATEALAVHHEHRVRNLEAARSFALQALPLERISSLLLSPYFAMGGSEERLARAEFDAFKHAALHSQVVR